MSTRFNTKKLSSALFLLLVVAGIWLWNRLQTEETVANAATDTKIKPWADEPIQPIPLENDLDKRKMALGAKLFNDPQLSHDNSISCASCHSLSLGGTDQLAHSNGVGGLKGLVNTPTVFNSGYNFRQFWDGRAVTLEEQVNGPTHAPNEMGSNWDEIKGKLSNSPDYQSAFAALYPDGIQSRNISDAIATYERSLNTPDAPFDKFLRGDQSSLTDEEKEGYRLFKSYGCISCHQGLNVGGNMFQKFGVLGDYFKDKGHVTKEDFGRYNVTADEIDKYVFKVPSLRNVALTHPYFHDGSVERLEDAVAVMSKYQLGRELSAQDIKLITQFLKTLTGEYRP